MFRRRTTQQTADYLVECPVCHDMVYMSTHKHTEEELRKALPDREALLAMHSFGPAQNRKDRRRHHAKARKILTMGR